MKKSIFLALLFSIISFATVHATQFVSDVLLIGGTWDEVCDLEKIYQDHGWETINKDLNEGAGGDYIYLMVKYDESDGINYGYITDFILYNGKADDLFFQYQDRVYYLTDYDGGAHFEKMKGNLNSNTGDNTDNIYLYYTKTPFSDNRAISSIYFDSDKNGAIGRNGSTSEGYDLNAGAHGSYIYMHTPTDQAISSSLSGSGKSAEDPILITSAADWATLSTNVADGLYLDQLYHFKLTNDIPTADENEAGHNEVSIMMGSQYIPFSGYFYGAGHSLNVNLSHVTRGVAPFREIDGAYISGLTVTGKVYGTENHASGLVGICTGGNIISNCHVFADITSPGYAGGLVGHGGQLALKITDSYCESIIKGFDRFAGGLMGWCDNLELYINNCYFNGSFKPGQNGKFHPIACKWDRGVVKPEIYYTYYNFLVQTSQELGDNHIDGADGIAVSDFPQPGIMDFSIVAADGKTHYADCNKVPELTGIYDLQTVLDNYHGKNVRLAFEYTFNENNAQLLCFPITMDEVNGGTIYQLRGFSKELMNGSEQWVATMQDATPEPGNVSTVTTPGMPYLFLPEENATIIFTGSLDNVPEKITDLPLVECGTVAGWIMRGTYTGITTDSKFGNVYAVATATATNTSTGESFKSYLLFKAGEGSVFEPHDAYFTYFPDENEEVPSMVLIRLIDKQGNITAVGSINTETGEIKIDTWYDLSGRRLEGEPKKSGIYLHNGKKVMIK